MTVWSHLISLNVAKKNNKNNNNNKQPYVTKFSRMDQVKFGRQSLKNLKGYGLLEAAHTLNFFKGCLSSTNFTWFILEYFVHMNPFQLSIAFGIETIHLIYSANQMSDFYRKCNTRQKWVNGMLTSYLRFDFWLLLIQSLMCSYHQFLRPFLKVF